MNDPELEQIIDPPPREFSCCRRCTCPVNTKWLLLLVMLLVQLVGLIMFCIWGIDCFFTEFHPPATCKKFDLFPTPQLYGCLWLFTTSAAATLLIYQILWLSPGFCGTRTVIRHLLKKAYFYKISFLLLVVLAYDVYVISNGPNIWKALFYLSFILEKALTVVLMLFLNFLSRFWNYGDSRLKFWVYKAAVLMFSLQNFVLALLGATIAAYKVLSVPGPKAQKEQHDPKAVIGLMLLIINNGYRYFVGEFFFSKIFDDDLNILGGTGKRIDESMNTQEQEEHENDEDVASFHRLIQTPPVDP